eukprot:Hpha_TRINITY_DN16223_c2_g4::TRINITY_DN16223_c2_g4_i3::g.13277::m.13277
MQHMRAAGDKTAGLQSAVAEARRDAETSRAEVSALRDAALRSRQLAQSAERWQRDLEQDLEAVRARAVAREEECTRLSEQLREAKADKGDLEGQLAGLRRRFVHATQGAGKEAEVLRAELDDLRDTLTRRCAAHLTYRLASQRSAAEAEERTERRLAQQSEHDSFERLNAVFRCEGWGLALEALLRKSRLMEEGLTAELGRERKLRAALQAEKGHFEAVQGELRLRLEHAEAVVRERELELSNTLTAQSAEKEADAALRAAEAAARAAETAASGVEVREARLHAEREVQRRRAAEEEAGEEHRALQLRVLEVLQEERKQRDGREAAELRAESLASRLAALTEASAQREEEMMEALNNSARQTQQRIDRLTQLEDEPLSEDDSSRVGEGISAEARSCIETLSRQLRVLEGELAQRDEAYAALRRQLLTQGGTVDSAEQTETEPPSDQAEKGATSAAPSEAPLQVRSRSTPTEARTISPRRRSLAARPSATRRKLSGPGTRSRSRGSSRGGASRRPRHVDPPHSAPPKAEGEAEPLAAEVEEVYEDMPPDLAADWAAMVRIIPAARRFHPTRRELLNALSEREDVQRLLCFGSEGDVDERRITALALLLRGADGHDGEVLAAWGDFAAAWQEAAGGARQRSSRRDSGVSSSSTSGTTASSVGEAAASVRALRHASRAVRAALDAMSPAMRSASPAERLRAARDAGDARGIRETASDLLRREPNPTATAELLRAITLVEAAASAIP